METYSPSDSRSSSKSRTILISVAVLALIALAVLAYSLTQASQSDQTTDTSQNSELPGATSSDNTASSDQMSSGAYSEGSYTATASYSSPGGSESIEITLAVDTEGVVQSATATSRARNSTAKGYQRQFIGGFSSQVIGKDIDSLKLSRVSGSSLTPNGFNKALEQIKQDAATS